MVMWKIRSQTAHGVKEKQTIFTETNTVN